MGLFDTIQGLNSEHHRQETVDTFVAIAFYTQRHSHTDFRAMLPNSEVYDDWVETREEEKSRYLRMEIVLGDGHLRPTFEFTANSSHGAFLFP